MSGRVRRLFWAALGAASACLLPSPSAAAPETGNAAAADTQRHQLDRQDLQRMQEASPEAAALFRSGEARFEQGALKEAAELLGRARALFPSGALAARRHCQALTELERREEAVAACAAARDLSHTVMDERAMVGAMLTGTKPPTVDELARAIRLTQLAKRLPDQPFGDAALCEVAYRMGDDGMLRHCVENLQRIAPTHFETRRWAAALQPPSAWPFLLGWGALAVIAGGTALNALLRRLRTMNVPQN